ncbi:lipoate--protein ligase family protein [Waterburya agarophytonicola K14]|uniref:Lipoate--protein ligase family protein n=1 Tax=Waterburya agarophytonicola KI4 TaxID=2874699 RepID=A0A964FHH7_9CYAN|nr:biotin/lipoate A/B protein ligase family protein [Waterburya agarophytonicola]MCC0177644.1 lipoate--protein ligase family protein [Waterburya agarophytonicola KI4]
MNTWRYIPPIEASGEMQMAIDRFLLEQHRQGKSPPIIRFYTWLPAAISLGYHQKDFPSAWKDLIWQGKPLDIIRRPTGGRAVLHQGDLTYAVVMSIPPGKRLEVYKQICQFLIEGWRSLGVDLEYGIATKEYIRHDNCFATATGSDLVTAAGNKVIGSAQLRRGKVVLQHGSMILDPDPQNYQQIFGTPLEEKLLTNIKQKGDYGKHSSEIECSRDKIIHNLITAAISTFKIDIVKQSLSTEEWQDIASDLSSLRY